MHHSKCMMMAVGEQWSIQPSPTIQRHESHDKDDDSVLAGDSTPANRRLLLPVAGSTVVPSGDPRHGNHGRSDDGHHHTKSVGAVSDSGNHDEATAGREQQAWKSHKSNLWLNRNMRSDTLRGACSYQQKEFSIPYENFTLYKTFKGP